MAKAKDRCRQVPSTRSKQSFGQLQLEADADRDRRDLESEMQPREEIGAISFLAGHAGD